MQFNRDAEENEKYEKQHEKLPTLFSQFLVP